MKVQDSLLYKDLFTDSRDAMFRAMTYIARCGGPSITGPSDDFRNLQANREPMRAWLVDHKATVVKGYDEYRKRWGPVFKD